jgi:hypothetical protein
LAGEIVTQVGTDANKAAVGEIRELEDVEDEPEPHGFEGIDPAQGDPVKELLEKNVPIHRPASNQRRVPRYCRDRYP